MNRLLSSNRSIALVGLIIFSFLAFLSLHFFLERMATYDPAFFSFLMLDSGKPEAVLGRYGTYVSQILPWIALKFGVSLSGFLKSYSISFVLLYTVFFILTLYVVKSKKAALAMVLCCTIGYHYSFYYSTAELYQGLALMCLLWGMLDQWHTLKLKQQPLAIATALLLAIWISFYHQILIIPLLFVIAYLVLKENGEGRKRWQLIAYALLIGWFIFRILYFEKSSYEAERMVKLHDFIEHTPRFFTLPSWMFFRWEINEMPALIISMLLSGGLLLLTKSWLRVLLFATASSGFLYLVVITDQAGQSPVMYENYYTIFGFFASVVIADAVYRLKEFPFQKALQPLVLLLLLLGSYQVYTGHTPFTQLVNYYANTTKHMLDKGISKGVVSASNHPWNFSWMSWPTPFTAALVSTVRHDGNTVSLYPAKDIYALKNEQRLANEFLGPEWSPHWFTSDNLDTLRFSMPMEEYVFLTTNGNEDHLNVADSVSLIIPEKVKMASGPLTFVPVRILNSSADTLHALAFDLSVKLRYRISWNDGDYTSDDGLEDYGSNTSLDMDVMPKESREVLLAIKKPPHTGSYSVTVDLFSDHIRHWWGIEQTFEFEN